MYYEYWGLHKPPFDNVPDPSMYVDCHPSMENALAEALFAIEEGNECLAVVIGDVGLGKTLTLRMIIDSLDQEKYKIALVTNPSISFTQLMQEMIGQLSGEQCLEKRKAQLLEIFNKTIFETSDAGKKVVLLIDEANAMPPASLENLRLLTNMQDDSRNLFTIVLAGQVELARKLEHPKRQNLYQRIGTYSRIERIQTEELVKAYVEKRIALAGGRRALFSDDAFPFIWEFSGHGVPRLTNKICKLSLKAGETNHFEQVSGELVYQVGQRFQGLSAPVATKRKTRKSSEESPSVRGEEPFKKPSEQPETAALRQSGPPATPAAPSGPAPAVPAEPAVVVQPEPTPSGQTETAPAPALFPEAPAALPSVAVVISSDAPVEEAPSRTWEPAILERKPEPPALPEFPVPSEAAPAVRCEQPPQDELEINAVKIQLPLNPDLIAEAQSGSEEFRVKLAGVLAAQTLKKYPELTSSPAVDPVNIWSEIRGHVLRKFDYTKASLAC
jgi:general secretion pathway protein A